MFLIRLSLFATRIEKQERVVDVWHGNGTGALRSSFFYQISFSSAVELRIKFVVLRVLRVGAR